MGDRKKYQLPMCGSRIIKRGLIQGHYELVINPHNSQGARHRCAVDNDRARPRGDRLVAILLHLLRSALACAGFRPPAIAELPTRSGGRRLKSAKARNRGGE